MCTCTSLWLIKENFEYYEFFRCYKLKNKTQLIQACNFSSMIEKCNLIKEKSYDSLEFEIDIVYSEKVIEFFLITVARPISSFACLILIKLLILMRHKSNINTKMYKYIYYGSLIDTFY
jgi:hypothetical protein